MKENFILFADTFALYYGPLKDNREHKHNSIQITLSEKPGFNLVIDKQTIKITHGVMIKPNLTHQVDSKGEKLLLVLIDPDSASGKGLNAYFKKANHMIELTRPLPHPGSWVENLMKKKSLKLLLSALNLPLSLGEKQQDVRIQKAKKYIKHHIKDGSLTVKSIADYTALSESRLQHLFKELTGIPLSGYILWRRVLMAVKQVIGHKKDFTYSSFEAGFSDYPHMSRTFKNFFGYNPSELLKDSRNVQALFLETE